MENVSLTYRIVGAIVILSLGIIFIPLFLDTDRITPGKISQSPIPEIPSEISTIVFQLNEKTGEFEPQDLSRAEKLKQDVTREMEAAANEVELAAATAELEKTGQTVAEGDAPGHTYVLQLASFKDKENAIELRDKLRNMGYVTNVSATGAEGSQIWRVRVGPEVNRQRIDKMAADLQAKLKLDGLIVQQR